MDSPAEQYLAFLQTGQCLAPWRGHMIQVSSINESTMMTFSPMERASIGGLKESSMYLMGLTKPSAEQ